MHVPAKPGGTWWLGRSVDRCVGVGDAFSLFGGTGHLRACRPSAMKESRELLKVQRAHVTRDSGSRSNGFGSEYVYPFAGGAGNAGGGTR